jgi:pyrimidine deaminase RibD-like protein
MFKNLLFGICLFGVTIANAKSYHITISEPYKVGATQLTPGDYRIVVNGANAALEDEHGQVQATGSLENEAKKFDATAVVSDNANGTPQLRTIELGGTRLQIDFK